MNLLFRTTTDTSLLGEVSITVLRVYAGLAMAFAHGTGKVPPPQQLIDGVASMGFPAPVAFAWIAGLSELLGGAFVAAGFMTRPAAFLVSCVMATAALVVHGKDAFMTKELSLLYFFVFLVFALRGSNRLSIDHFIRR